MSNTILLKRSGTSGKVPLTANLALGELSINYTDGRLYGSTGSTVFDLKQNDPITLSGDATGTSTNPSAGSPWSNLAVTLSTVNSNTGVWGGTTQIPTFTVNGKGLVTAAGNIALNTVAVTGITSTGAGNLTLSGSVGAITVALPATGPGATTVGSATSIPVVTVDNYGRVTALTSSSISTSFTVNGTTGTTTVAGGSTFTYASTNGMVIGVGTEYANISTPQDIRTTATPSFAGLTSTGVVTSTGNVVAASGTASSNTTTGALVVAGGAGISGAVNVGGITTLSSATATTGVNTGALQVTSGGAYISGNLWVGGNINFTPGSVNTIQGNSAQFFGNAAGFGAIYAGINSGYVIQPQTVLQNSTNFNGYAQVNHQNISNGTAASTDYVATADTGTAGAGYIDMGINSSGFVGGAGNELNYALDGYLYVTGTTSSNGNLLIGTSSQTDVVIATAGFGTVNQQARFKNNVGLIIYQTTSSTNTTSGALQVAGGAGIQGAVYAGSVYDNGTRVVSTSSGAGNLSISSGAVTLPATGPGATTVGSATSIPVITTDAYGRVVGLTSSSISTSFTLNGTTGTASVSGGSVLSFASTNGVVVTVGTEYANIATPQDIRTTASPTFAAGTFNGTVVATTVNAATLGNASATLIGSTGYIGTINASTVNAATIGNTGATLTGTLSTAAQPNITSTGTLTGLTVSGTTTLQGNVQVTGGGEFVTNNLVVTGNLYVAGNNTIVNATSVTTNDLAFIAAANAGSAAAANGAGLLTPYSAFTFNSATTAWNSNVAIYGTALYDNTNRVLTVASSHGSTGGDVSVTGTYNALTLTLNTVNTNTGTFGNATYNNGFTVNGKGLITGVATQLITPAWSSITSTPTTIAGYGIVDALSTSSTVDGGTY